MLAIRTYNVHHTVQIIGYYKDAETGVSLLVAEASLASEKSRVTCCPVEKRAGHRERHQGDT